jgi:hypothetical protein
MYKRESGLDNSATDAQVATNGRDTDIGPR